MKKYRTADEYILKAKYGKEILLVLREIILKTKLEETIKWGMPVYTFNGKNVVGLGAFKSYSGLWFYQGSSLNDNQKVLVSAQGEKTKALRQWRFASVHEIDKNLVLSYLNEAIQNQKQGKELKPERNIGTAIPEELQQVFTENNELENCFRNLYPGCQKEYINYILEGKKPETRIRRTQKIIPLILQKKGLNDKYKK